MMVEPCPFVPFVTVVQCAFKGGKARDYRFVHFDARKGHLIFFDLSYSGASMGEMFVTKRISEIVEMTEQDIRVVEDRYISDRMRSCQPVMSAGVRDQWMTRWRRLRSLVDTQFADEDLLEGHGIADIYTDEGWRDRVIEKQAKRMGCSKWYIRDKLATFIRHGGTMQALIPLTDLCGARGKPKCMKAHANKSGRLTTQQRRQRAKKGRDNVPKARNRFTAFWNQRMNEAFDALIDRDGPWAILVIKKNQDFLEYFYANHCWDPSYPEEGMRRTIDPRRVPSAGSLLYHRDRILRDRPDLSIVGDAGRRVAGGSARDLTYDVLDIADLDGARFPEVSLVLADDDAPNVPLKEYVQIGEPVVMFAIARKSSAYVGWYLTLGERGESYQHCIYNTLMDKAPRLMALGLNPEDYPGICSGAFDQVVVDRGAGASAKVMEWTVEGIRLDLRMARAGVPEDKGSVEGGIGRFKTHLRRNGILSRLVRRTVLQRFRALPVGVLTLRRLNEARKARRIRKANIKLIATPKAFERLIVETINELNLKRRTSIAGMTEEMLLAGVAPTPLSMHRYFQGLRRGNAAYPRSDADLRASLLPKRLCTVAGGKIRVGQFRYGSPSSTPEGEQGAQALLAHVRLLVPENPTGGTIKITVAVEPYGNYAWWLRGPGDWVLLAPDIESEKTWGVHRDFIERAGLEAHLAIENAKVGANVVAKKLKAVTAAQSKAIGDIEAHREGIDKAKGNVNKAARKEAQKTQQAERYNESAAEVGLRPSTKAPPTKATPSPAGEDPWADPTSLAELFANTETRGDSVDGVGASSTAS